MGSENFIAKRDNRTHVTIMSRFCFHKPLLSGCLELFGLATNFIVTQYLVYIYMHVYLWYICIFALLRRNFNIWSTADNNNNCLRFREGKVHKNKWSLNMAIYYFPLSYRLRSENNLWCRGENKSRSAVENPSAPDDQDPLSRLILPIGLIANWMF